MRQQATRFVVLFLLVPLLGACAGTPPPSWVFQSATPAQASGSPVSSTAASPAASPTSAATATATAALTPAPTATSQSTASPAPTASAPSATPTTGPVASPIGVPPTGLAIYLSEWSVALPTSMSTGPVNVTITNIGTMQHELLVFKSDLAPDAYPVDSQGTIIEDGPGITLVSRGDPISPGKTETRVVDLTQPGTYLFVCNLPGHFKAGMFRVVTVTTPAQQQAYIPAALSEWHIAAPSTITAGSVILEAANFGTIQHEILVFKSDLPSSSYPLDKDGNIIEDDPSINLLSDGDNLDPGTTQTRTVDLTQPGSYLFVCNIPGHFKAGMYSPITVTP